MASAVRQRSYFRGPTPPATHNKWPLTPYPPRTHYANTAGVTDAADFFTQVCDLATAPLAVMQASRDAGGDLSAMSTALTAAGYEVFSTDTYNSQLELSACATRYIVGQLTARLLGAIHHTYH